MSLLRSNELRVLLKHEAALTDISGDVRSFSNAGESVSWSTEGTALFIGFRHKFNHRYFKTGKSGAAVGEEPSGEEPSKLLVHFWNGTAWEAFTDVIDETDGLTTSGFVVWEDQPKWVKAEVSDIADLAGYENESELYWVRLTLDDDFDSITLKSVKFILSDDRIMSQIFPEITEYYPSGKSDFLDQHEAAKDWIVTSLKVKDLIAYQEQIKNPDDWMMAATYRAIEMILMPIAGDERLLEIKRDIAAKSAHMLNIAKASLDKNKNQDLDADENPDGSSVTAGAITGWMTR